MYTCPSHGWVSESWPCPSCIQTITSTVYKHIEPQSFDQVEKIEQVIVEGQFWQNNRSDNIRLKVMATKDKYAMVRRKGAMPFVLSFHSLKDNYTPIPIQSKKKKQSHARR